jgi:hypothetical protein
MHQQGKIVEFSSAAHDGSLAIIPNRCPFFAKPENRRAIVFLGKARTPDAPSF